MKALRTADVERFRSAISLRLGLHFDDEKLGFLAELFVRRLDATGEDAGRYHARLESGVDARQEIRELARDLTVSETYFFRHFDQFQACGEVALPARLNARSPDESIRILCAGCASGEEAFSLAILVRERVPEGSARVVIRAFDVNPAVIERAARPSFSAWALRETPEELRRRWFRQEGREFALDPSVRAAVSFEEQNLLADDPDLWREHAYDVVFFRNVLMYLSPEAVRTVVARMARAIVPGGFLFLGHAETLRGLSNDFHLRHTHDTFYYQRKPSAQFARGLPEFASSTLRPRFEHATFDISTTWVETIRRASERIKLLAERRVPDVAASPSAAGVATPELHSALELLRDERFGEALARLDGLPPSSALDPDVMLLKASLLVHRGELERAESVCSELVLLDELSAGAHYLLALCREGLGDVAGALERDRIAIYLDEEFAMPHLHLGLMARRAGDGKNARVALERAIALLAREDASRLLMFGGGFGREGLVALCRAELARMESAP